MIELIDFWSDKSIESRGKLKVKVKKGKRIILCLSSQKIYTKTLKGWCFSRKRNLLGGEVRRRYTWRKKLRSRKNQGNGASGSGGPSLPEDFSQVFLRGFGRSGTVSIIRQTMDRTRTRGK